MSWSTHPSFAKIRDFAIFAFVCLVQGRPVKTLKSFYDFGAYKFSLLFCRVIVGAPEDDSEQAKVGIEKAGAVYRCQTEMPFRCDQIPFDTSGKRKFLNFPAFLL